MPLIENYYLVIDFETSSPNPHTCQPTQIAAQLINPRSLEPVPHATFNSLMKPIGLDVDEVLMKELEDASKVTGITAEMLRDAPEQKFIWEHFCNFVHRFNRRNSTFTAPIMAGYNIIRFDSIIVDRLSKEYGPWDAEFQQSKLFNALHYMDILRIAFEFFEDMDVGGPENLKLPTLLEFVGIDTSGSHDALIDVKNTSRLLARFMKRIRQAARKTKYRDE